MNLTVQQCAKQLGIVSHSVRKWIWAGKLPAQKIPKGREQWTYLVSADDWHRFLEEREKVKLPDARSLLVPTTRPPHSHIYFESSNPDDRLVKQTALMKKALRGCRASRDALREHPYRLTYWLVVDGPEKEGRNDDLR